MFEEMPVARLQHYYRETVAPKLREQFSYRNVMEVPRITKITLNMGVGEAVADKKIMEHAVGNLTQIAGQKPVVTLSRRSIAGFKIREGWPIGCKVTLRRDRMYEFLDRLVNIAIPRIRDFRGFSARAFDGRGNYSLGVREQIIFPEIDYDKIDKIKGMNITIVTTAQGDDEAREFLTLMGMPFRT
jgi:large subunit ribosomal protein L5